MAPDCCRCTAASASVHLQWAPTQVRARTRRQSSFPASGRTARVSETRGAWTSWARIDEVPGLVATTRTKRWTTARRAATRTDSPACFALIRGVPSRRDVLRGLAASGLGLTPVGLPEGAGAQPKRRKKRTRPKPARPNQFSCLDVNDRCRRHTQCCSGRYTGKPGKKRCRVHGTGTCNQRAPGICDAAIPALSFCNSLTACGCVRTTAGSSYCGVIDLSIIGCASCKRNADCVRLGFPPGSACAPTATGNCAGDCATGMVCLVPCGAVPPPRSRNRHHPIKRPSHRSGVLPGDLGRIPAPTTRGSAIAPLGSRARSGCSSASSRTCIASNASVTYASLTTKVRDRPAASKSTAGVLTIPSTAAAHDASTVGRL